MTHAEVTCMDPLQRLLLETSYQGLENGDLMNTLWQTKLNYFFSGNLNRQNQGIKDVGLYRIISR